MADDLGTERLALRPWSDAATDLLVRLSADPAVIRYVGDGTRWSADKATDVSRAMIEHWRAHEFGWRVAVEKSSAQAIGFIGLNYVGGGTVGVDPGEFEIGWWLWPAWWRRGLAREGARAVCEEAFERVRALSLVARLQPANHASAGVATGLGMTHELDTTGRTGERVAVYRLAVADWRAQHGR